MMAVRVNQNSEVVGQTAEQWAEATKLYKAADSADNCGFSWFNIVIQYITKTKISIKAALSIKNRHAHNAERYVSGSDAIVSTAQYSEAPLVRKMSHWTKSPLLGKLVIQKQTPLALTSKKTHSLQLVPISHRRLRYRSWVFLPTQPCFSSNFCATKPGCCNPKHDLS